MCNIKLKNLSPNLYNEAVKYAKEGTLNKNIDKLINTASEKGINKYEKAFLEGLASEKNVQILKDSKNSPSEITFIEPGIDLSNKKVADTKHPGVVQKKDIKEQSFFSNFVNKAQQFGSGVSENIAHVDIRLKIDKSESKTKFNNTLAREVSNREGINFKSLDKNYSIAFNLLDDKSKKQINELINSPSFEKADVENLKALATKGTLKRPDKDGKTVLDNIYSLYKGPVLVGEKKGEYKKDNQASKELAKDAINVLLSSAYVTQGEHYTCGSSSVENYLRINDPGELVRIVKDLSMKGEVTLRDGKTMNAPTGSLNFKAGDRFKTDNTSGLYKDHNTEDRSRFNIIFQSAVMDEIALVGGDRSPLNPSLYDVASYDVKNDVDGQWVNGDGSSYWPAIKNLTDSIMNEKGKQNVKIETHGMNDVAFATNMSTEDSSPRIAKELENFFTKNPGKQAIIMYHSSVEGKKSQDGAHYVMANRLVKKDDGKMYVEIFNTMANTEKDGYRNKTEDPDRKVHGQIIYKSLDELSKTLNSVVLFK